MRQRKPTLKDIARDSGSSLATVSRALSNPELVQSQTLEHIRETAARLGYIPNRRAKALAAGHSETIGVVVPTLNSPIFSTTLHEMQRSFAANGFQLLIASHEYDPSSEAAAFSQLIAHGVDGLIIVGARRPQSSWVLLEAAQIPIIQIWEGRPDHDRITVDNQQAGYMVARYLVDIGHRRFGVICGHLLNNDRQSARVEGIREALSQDGLTLARTQISEQPLSISAGRAGCMTLLEMLPRPTAIIGTADLLAIGAMFEAQGRGIVVPDAVSIAGIDNVDVAAHLSPSLTTVDIPASNIGAEAASLMLRRLSEADATPGTSISLPVNLVVRHSTARPID